MTLAAESIISWMVCSCDCRRIGGLLVIVRPFIIASLAVMLEATPLIAGLVGDEAWKAESSNGRYIVVMNPSMAMTQRNSSVDKSGVYVSDGSGEMLWELPYYSQVYEAYVSPDGEHVVVSRENWCHSISNIPPGGSIHFFHRDGSSQHYRDYEVIRMSLFKWLVSLVVEGYPKECQDARFDASRLTYTVVTSHGDEITLSVSAGTVEDYRSPWALWTLGIVASVPLLVWWMHRDRLQGTKHRDAQASDSKLQISICESLFGIAVVGMIAGIARHSVILGVGCAVVASLGGMIASVYGGRLRAAVAGAMLSLYGGFVAAVLVSLVQDVMMLNIYRHAFLLMVSMAVAVVGGSIYGGGVGGWLEKRRL